ncbi:MAG: hypothetical protein ACXAB4_05475 [Candidatus Hodarchaeales archaeon]|jgi:hypothetical protein
MTGGEHHKNLVKEYNEEMRHIEAAQAVLKRKGLNFLDQMRTEGDMNGYLSVLALWQNEDFLAEVEAAVLAELAPDPGGVRRFLADFEAQIENLDARWLLSLWRQTSGESVVNFAPLLKEYQEAYTSDLLQKLEVMQETPGIDPITQRRLNLWQDVVTRELVDVVLEPQRTTLRQTYATYSFHLNGRQYSVSEIAGKILREEQKRNVRHEAWANLVDLSQQIEPMLREFLLRTNALWQERDYANAINPRLQAIGVSETVVRQVIANIEQASRSTAQKLISAYEDFLGHELEPWDWRFVAGQMMRPFEQCFEKIDAITCVKQTYEHLGIAIDQLPIQIVDSSATYETNRHCVRIPHDILFSYGPLSGYRKNFILVRDLGIASSFAHIDEELAYPFRRYAPEVLFEGLGMLVSWVLWDSSWLEEFTDLTADQIKEFIRQMKGFELLKTRHYAGLALFEIDAYAMLEKDSEADLTGLYARHMERFLCFPNGEHSVWAAEPRLIQPLPYLSQYTLALAVAANLMAYSQRRGMALFSPHFGDLLRSDLVRLGNASSWVERLQQLTTRTLTPVPMSWSTT